MTGDDLSKTDDSCPSRHFGANTFLNYHTKACALMVHIATCSYILSSQVEVSDVPLIYIMPVFCIHTNVPLRRKWGLSFFFPQF